MNHKQKFRQHYTWRASVILTFSVGAGIRTKAGIGGDPPLNAFVCILVATTDLRRRGVRARDAMVLIANS